MGGRSASGGYPAALHALERDPNDRRAFSGTGGVITTREGSELAWTFRDRLRVALLREHAAVGARLHADDGYTSGDVAR